MTGVQGVQGEALLIARLKLTVLIAAELWEDAVEVGMRALTAAAGHADEETTRIAIALAGMGLLVDSDVVSHFLCGAHSCARPLPQPLLREATAALKRLVGHDVDAWSRGILRDEGASLETLDAMLQLLDIHTSSVVVQRPAFQTTIQRELCNPDEARRAAALQSIGTAVLITPALAVPLLPILVRAVFVETDSLKHAALANVLDAAFALARMPPPPAEGSDEQRLFSSLMQWLPQLLHAPQEGMQTLAALGLAKLVLHREEESLLCASADPELIVAQLGRRYTTCDTAKPTGEAASKRTGGEATHNMPNLMPILLAFFEELKASRQDDLGNTVSWMLLDALEGKRHLHEIDGETHRCAKFVFSLIAAGNADVAMEAICMNVESMLGLALSPAARNDVAAWLGKSTAGVPVAAPG